MILQCTARIILTDCPARFVQRLGFTDLSAWSRVWGDARSRRHQPLLVGSETRRNDTALYCFPPDRRFRKVDHHMRVEADPGDSVHGGFRAHVPASLHREAVTIGYIWHDLRSQRQDQAPTFLQCLVHN